jgi:uncharacterized protein
MLDSSKDLALGLLIGLVFGFALQKGRVTKFRVIVGQFLLRDFTVLKVMLTAIVVGSIGVHALVGLDLASFSIKPAQLLAVGLGGLLFGVGMVLLGFCPGTAFGGLAEGSRPAATGILGMAAGAVAFAFSYGFISRLVLPVGDLGPVTLPGLSGLPSWVLVTALAAVSIGIFVVLERRARLPIRTAAPGEEAEAREEGTRFSS